MGSVQRYGLNNSLIRWVHRHTRMATLFRSSLPSSQLGLSPRSLPSYRSAIQPTVQGSLPEEASFEPHIVSPVIDQPRTATPSQMADPAESTFHKNAVPSHKPSASKSSAPQAEQKPQDRDWQRLQAIFRKHEGQAEATPASTPEAAPVNTEPSAEPTLQDAFPEDAPSEPKQSEQHNEQTVFGQRHMQAQTKTDHVSSSRGPQTDVVHANLPGSSQENKELKQEEGTQRPQTIQRSQQEQAQTGFVTIPEQITAPTEATVSDLRRASQQKEQPNLPQRVWQGLRSVFRKPQQPDELSTASIEDPTKLATESTEPELRRPPSNTNEPARSAETPEVDQNALSGEQLSIQRSAIAVSSTKPVQRSAEKKEGEFSSPETKAQMKSESHRSVPHSSGSIEEAESNWTGPDNILPEEMPEISDDAPITDHLQQPLHLQSIWNVQRAAATELDEPIAYQDESRTLLAVEPGLSKKSDQDVERGVDSERTVFRPEQKHTREMDNLETPGQPSFESSRTPVEILAPSRPRPRGASVMSSSPKVQRQTENRNTTDEIKESALVETAIGPLPADLWTLLGQKPPASSHPSQMDNQTPVGFNQTEYSSDQKVFPPQSTTAGEEKSVNVTHLPAAIQRETLPTDPAKVPSSREQGQAAQNKKPSQPEPDVNELARKVYAEVRRRLATEWERSRRHI